MSVFPLRPSNLLKFRTLLFMLLVSSLTGCSRDTNPPAKWEERPQKLDEVSIKVKDKAITVELALTPAEQAKGLMYRDIMPEDHGMLFVYSKPRKVKYYMLNCRFPLSVAFIGEDGTIDQIEDMQPREQLPTYSKNPVKYVLELNQGWFERNGVKGGDKVEVKGL